MCQLNKKTVALIALNTFTSQSLIYYRHWSILSTFQLKRVYPIYQDVVIQGMVSFIMTGEKVNGEDINYI